MMKGFYRLLEWEWYSDTNMVRLFIHLLLNANCEPQEWRNYKIPPGSLVTSLHDLSNRTGLSVQSVRTCLNRLVSSNEIEIISTYKERIILLHNYSLYLSEIDEPPTSEIHATNKVNNKPNNKVANKLKSDKTQSLTPCDTDIYEQCGGGENSVTNKVNNKLNNKVANKLKEEKESSKEKEEIYFIKEKIKNKKEKPTIQEIYTTPIDLLLDGFIAEASTSAIWLDAIAKNLHMTPLQVAALMRNDFRDHCIRNDKRHHDITEFKSHFNRWSNQRLYSPRQYEPNHKNNPAGLSGGLAAKLPVEPSCGIKRRPSVTEKTQVYGDCP